MCFNICLPVCGYLDELVIYCQYILYALCLKFITVDDPVLKLRIRIFHVSHIRAADHDSESCFADVLYQFFHQRTFNGIYKQLTAMAAHISTII